MKDENLIHVKLEYDEALQSKKDVLLCEMNLVRILNKIRKYHSLRLEELKIKSRLNRKIKELKTNINSIQTNLPKVKIPDILKHKRTETFETTYPKKTYDTDLEKELKDIQEKLNSLQA